IELTGRSPEVAGRVELADVPGRLRAHAIDRADIDAVGDRGRRLLQVPEILAETGDGRRRVPDQLGAVERERTPALGEVPVVADVDAELADLGIEHGIAEIARLEEELLVEAGDLRDMHLAELAEIFAVGVDDGGG